MGGGSSKIEFLFFFFVGSCSKFAKFVLKLRVRYVLGLEAVQASILW